MTKRNSLLRRRCVFHFAAVEGRRFCDRRACASSKCCKSDIARVSNDIVYKLNTTQSTTFPLLSFYNKRLRYWLRQVWRRLGPKDPMLQYQILVDWSKEQHSAIVVTFAASRCRYGLHFYYISFFPFHFFLIQNYTKANCLNEESYLSTRTTRGMHSHQSSVFSRSSFSTMKVFYQYQCFWFFLVPLSFRN